MNKIGIRNCDLTFKQCDKYWTEFKKTSKTGIRFCLDCERLVQKVESTEELREVLKNGKCVAYFLEKEPPLIGYVVEL